MSQLQFDARAPQSPPQPAAPLDGRPPGNDSDETSSAGQSGGGSS